MSYMCNVIYLQLYFFLLKAMSSTKRLLVYTVPVTMVSFALNIPKFFEVRQNTVWIDFFLKTMIPRDRWLRHWFGGLVWCLVLLVGRLLRDSLRPSSLFSLAKYQPNDITKKRSRKRKSSKIIDHRKKYIPIKIRGSVARTIRTCVGIVSTCVKLGFIGVCYSAVRQFIIHEHSWTGLDLISPKREQRLKRENFQRVNPIRWGSGLYR